MLHGTGSYTKQGASPKIMVQVPNGASISIHDTLALSLMLKK